MDVKQGQRWQRERSDKEALVTTTGSKIDTSEKQLLDLTVRHETSMSDAVSDLRTMITWSPDKVSG